MITSAENTSAQLSSLKRFVEPSIMRVAIYPQDTRPLLVTWPRGTVINWEKHSLSISLVRKPRIVGCRFGIKHFLSTYQFYTAPSCYWSISQNHPRANYISHYTTGYSYWSVNLDLWKLNGRIAKSQHENWLIFWRKNKPMNNLHTERRQLKFSKYKGLIFVKFNQETIPRSV